MSVQGSVNRMLGSVTAGITAAKFLQHKKENDLNTEQKQANLDNTRAKTELYNTISQQKQMAMRAQEHMIAAQEEKRERSGFSGGTLNG